jgi:hypothetical protein
VTAEARLGYIILVKAGNNDRCCHRVAIGVITVL